MCARLTNADRSADADGVSDYANAILFAGYYYDWETGLYHVRNRMYHAAVGRWLQRDPLGYVNGMGLYEMLDGRVVNHTDPMGLLDWNTLESLGRVHSEFGVVYEVFQIQPNDETGWIKGAVDTADTKVYWCHAYTFGGMSDKAQAAIKAEKKKGGKEPFNIFGGSVRHILKHDGWRKILCADAFEGDIAVFYDRTGVQPHGVKHSGIIRLVRTRNVGTEDEPRNAFDEEQSLLASKWGRGGKIPPPTKSFKANLNEYNGTKYRCYTRRSIVLHFRPSCTYGANELPIDTDKGDQ